MRTETKSFLKLYFTSLTVRIISAIIAMTIGNFMLNTEVAQKPLSDQISESYAQIQEIKKGVKNE